MTARAAHVLTDCSQQQLQMVAEVLACVDRDPQRRRSHRLAKIETFPENERATVKQLVNRVLEERAKPDFSSTAEVHNHVPA